jgi:(R,R)-butanediol dehydrogenase/meso-butanediol dehydrogenase/diacetyl reductase
MRAAVFKAAGEELAIETTAEPEPAAGEILLKIGRCGICSTDLHMTEGHAPIVPSGTVLGHEFAGEIVALGSGVERLEIGDRIAVMPLRGCGSCAACLGGTPVYCTAARPFFGGFAEYAIATERESIRLPDGLSLADGALIEPLAVALHGVAMAGIKPGAEVLVIGAGPIGLGAIYWARRSGAKRITVIEGVPQRMALAEQLGATQCLTPDRVPVTVEDIRFGGIYGGDTADIVFECVGRPGLLGVAMKKARPGGTVVSLGCCTTPDAILPALGNVKELTLKFPICYSLRDFETTADALDSGGIEPRAMITDTVSLSGLPEAFEALRAGAGQCKLMIDPAAAQ